MDNVVNFYADTMNPSLKRARGQLKCRANAYCKQRFNVTVDVLQWMFLNDTTAVEWKYKCQEKPCVGSVIVNGQQVTFCLRGQK